MPALKYVDMLNWFRSKAFTVADYSKAYVKNTNKHRVHNLTSVCITLENTCLQQCILSY